MMDSEQRLALIFDIQDASLRFGFQFEEGLRCGLQLIGVLCWPHKVSPNSYIKNEFVEVGKNQNQDNSRDLHNRS